MYIPHFQQRFIGSSTVSLFVCRQLQPLSTEWLHISSLLQLWNRVMWNGVMWNVVMWNGVTWNRVTWNGVTWNRVTWNGVMWNGVT